MPNARHALFDSSGALFTNSWTDMFLWPVRDEAGLLKIGPPQKLPLAASGCRLACSHEGRVLAIPQFNKGALVWHADRQEPPIPLFSHEDVRSVAVSPNGKWVATASHDASLEVKVWEAGNGNLVT